MRATYVAIVTSVLLAGCKVGPDYHRPIVEVPTAYRNEPAQAPVATANVDWWTQFDDPVLTQLIAEGLAHNKTIKIAAPKLAMAPDALRPIASDK